MVIWLLGDSAISGDVAEFANAHSADVIDSSAPNVSVEEVWTSQLWDPAARRLVAQSWRGPGSMPPDAVVVLFLDSPDYDAEGTIARLTRRLRMDGAKLVYMIRADSSDNVLDAFTHYEEPWLRKAVYGVDSLGAIYDSWI